MLLTKLHSAREFSILPIHESGVKAMKLNFLALHPRGGALYIMFENHVRS